MKFYIIHLARAEARKANVEKLCAELPGDVEVLDAVDAQTLSPAHIDTLWLRDRPFPPYPFALRSAEIGCFLSYHNAWKRIAQGPETGAMIIEDDVLIDRALFDPALELVRAHAGAGDAVRFPAKLREKPKHVLAEANGARLFRPALTGLGTQAQFVGREAAEKLLAATKQFDRPVDTTLQMSWHTGVALKAVTPSGVREISNTMGGSLIGPSRQGLGPKLYREIARPAYRLALRATQALRGA